jgi:hypothetical protein
MMQEEVILNVNNCKTSWEKQKQFWKKKRSYETEILESLEETKMKSEVKIYKIIKAKDWLWLRTPVCKDKDGNI